MDVGMGRKTTPKQESGLYCVMAQTVLAQQCLVTEVDAVCTHKDSDKDLTQLLE